VRVDPTPLRPFLLEMIDLADADNAARLRLAMVQEPMGI